MEYNITCREKNKGYQCIVSYKDNRGRWKQKSRQGFATKRDAKAAADGIVEDIKNNAAVYLENSDITFGVFCKNYLHSLRAAEGTIRIYKTALQWFSSINNKRLSEVKYGDIRGILYSMPLKPSTANMYLGKIKTVFRAAVEHELINRNPAAAVRPIRSEHKKIHALTKERMERILDNVKFDYPVYVACCIAAYTGLRVGEVMGLTWSDIDFDGGMLHVRQQFGYRRLKTANSYRSVPLPERLIDILKSYQNSGSALFDKDLRNHINYRLKPYGVHMHDFRHTYATLLISAGFDVRTVAALLGDKVETVLNTYVHYNDEMRENAKRRLFKFF